MTAPVEISTATWRVNGHLALAALIYYPDDDTYRSDVTVLEWRNGSTVGDRRPISAISANPYTAARESLAAAKAAHPREAGEQGNMHVRDIPIVSKEPHLL